MPHILNRQASALAKRHLPVGVHPTRRIHHDGQRIHVATFAPAIREEIAEGTLYRRLLLSIPIRTYDKSTPMRWVRGHPDMLNSPRFLNISQRDSGPRRNNERRRDFPSLPKLSCHIRTSPFSCHPATAFRTIRILRADRACTSIRETREIAQMHAKSIERTLHNSISFKENKKRYLPKIGKYPHTILYAITLEAAFTTSACHILRLHSPRTPPAKPACDKVPDGDQKNRTNRRPNNGNS